MKRTFLFISFVILLLLLRFIFFFSFQDKIDDRSSDLQGIISSVPETSGGKQSFTVNGIQIITQRYPEYRYGDEIKLKLKTQSSKFKTKSQNLKLAYPKIELISRGKGYFVLTKIYKLRQRITDLYQNLLPEPEASLLSGIVLGVKSGLPYDFNRALIKTGTVHVVVASGTNITFFIGFLVFVLSRFFNRRLAVGLSFLGIIFYIALAGFQAPVIRAGIMGGVALGAQVFGRQNYGVLSLIITILVMLMLNPLYLLDVGFQLSVAATSGLMFVQPLFKSNLETYHGTSLRILVIFRRLFLVPLLGESLATTIAAQITTLPLLIYYFGAVSVLSPLVNMLILWTVPFIMILGGMIIPAVLFEPAARAVSYFTYGFLWFFTRMVNYFGKAGFGYWQLGKPSEFIIIGYYLLLGAVLFNYANRNPKK